MKINSTIFFTIASFMYSVLLMIAYFSKDKIKNPDNKIYSKLIVINFIGIILELLCTLFAGYAENHLLFYTILNKMFLIELKNKEFKDLKDARKCISESFEIKKYQP